MRSGETKASSRARRVGLHSERCAAISCPACGSTEVEEQWSVDTTGAALHFLSEAPRRQVEILEGKLTELWGSDTCCVASCRSCEFGFAVPFVAGDSVFYNISNPRSSYPAHKWEYTRTLKDLGEQRHSLETALEVGSGPGYFLKLLKQSYPELREIVALEYSTAARDELQKQSVRVLPCDIRDRSLTGKFEAIFMFQVLEHLDSIDQVFGRINDLLQKDGLVYLAVPNARRIAFNERHESLRDMPPNHIGRWSPKALESICVRHGLRVDRCETEPFHLRKFVKQDIAYAYLRAAQRRGSLAHFVRRWRSRPGGAALGMLTALVRTPSRVPVWIQAYREGDVGGSLWARLSKAV